MYRSVSGISLGSGDIIRLDGFFLPRDIRGVSAPYFALPPRPFDPSDMTSSVQVSRGIESLFGTRDENIRLIESGLNVSTRLGEDTLEIEGEPASVTRAE